MSVWFSDAIKVALMSSENGSSDSPEKLLAQSTPPSSGRSIGGKSLSPDLKALAAVGAWFSLGGGAWLGAAGLGVVGVVGVVGGGLLVEVAEVVGLGMVELVELAGVVGLGVAGVEGLGVVGVAGLYAGL